MKVYLSKVTWNIYQIAKNQFSIVLPSADKIVQTIAARDNAKVLPLGMTALNLLELSTQVPMNHTFLTTGRERIVIL